MQSKNFIPRLIVLELTQRCDLNCIHCRSSLPKDRYQDELTTRDWFKVLDDISSFSKPIIILSGGEALLRQDVFEIISYAHQRALTCVLATCGIPLTEEKADRLKQSGIKRVSVSLDGKDAQTHDRLRGQKGVFDKAVSAMQILRLKDIEFQVNTTVTRYNIEQLEDILKLAQQYGAVSFHPFFLVPVGRARQLRDTQLSPAAYEEALNWLYEESRNFSIDIKPTCAPFYARIARGSYSGGCLGGKYFAFISSCGRVQICGFLEVSCGNIREDNFVSIWDNSTVFKNLRDPRQYKGKCAGCEYLKICGGCRARAYAATGNYLQEEPECVYQPVRLRSGLIVSDQL